MKYISNGLFFAGFVLICAGVCTADVDILLAVKVAFGGLVLMFIGWLLDELFGWEVEDDDFQEYLRHLR